MPDKTRWLALYVLCAGMLMIVLDATIVNVALPTLRRLRRPIPTIDAIAPRGRNVCIWPIRRAGEG